MKLCAIVLAAGLSARMGENKLLLTYKGLPMCEHILRNIQRNGQCFCEKILVGRLPETEELARRYGFSYILNPQPERGMGHSLALAVRAAGGCGGFLLALADMPDLKEGTVFTLCESFAATPARIAVPVYGGKRGNPVIFPERFRAELAALEGDKGGRDVILREQGALSRVQVYDAGILRDIDTKEEYNKNSQNP